MSKTALELTAEDKGTYRLVRVSSKTKEAELAERRQHAWEVAKQATHLLRSHFEAKRIVLFGSLADRDLFTPWSDIDLAAWGIPALKFYRAVAAVTGLSDEFEIDLVDPVDCEPTLRRVIEQEGVVL
ncbi:MAG: nucleotidyltransferase domain-containing protein [bacterium]|nr:nucleotidyltransferase domain-containing protein [bacterium]